MNILQFTHSSVGGYQGFPQFLAMIIFLQVFLWPCAFISLRYKIGVELLVHGLVYVHSVRNCPIFSQSVPFYTPTSQMWSSSHSTVPSTLLILAILGGDSGVSGLKLNFPTEHYFLYAHCLSCFVNCLVRVF